MSVKKIEDLFGVSRELTLLILGTSILLIISMIYKIMAPPPIQHWQIIQNGQYHLTSDPVENGSCVDFTDEGGQTRTICGSYKIKRM
jgi:hypothetical protein